MHIPRFIEELFPFLSYLLYSRRQKRLSNSDTILNNAKYMNYSKLPEDKIKERIKEEHQRVLAMDEKTSKLMFSFSLALTFLGATIAFLKYAIFPMATQTRLSEIISFLVALGLFYCITAGLLAMGALRTAPLHGYGTPLLLKRGIDRKVALAKSLARQEIINSIRHLRNEAAFQSLRNGLLLFIATIIIFAIIFACRVLLPSP